MAHKFQGWSPYNYVLGNPISLVDPNGAKAVYVDGVKQSGYEANLWVKEAQANQSAESAEKEDCCPPDYGLGYSYMHGGKEGMERHQQGKNYAAAGALVGAAIIFGGAYAPGLGLRYLKTVISGSIFETGESLVFHQNLSNVDGFDIINPLNLTRAGNFTNSIFNWNSKGFGTNSKTDFAIDFISGEAGSYIGRRLKARGERFTERSQSLDNYQTLYPVINPANGRRNLSFSVSRQAQQLSDARYGAGLLSRGEYQGTLADVVMKNILKGF